MQVKRGLLLSLIVLMISSFSPKKDMSWVAIGDSITYLNDHLNETGNRVTKGYLTRVTEKLPHIHYINQGRNGWTAIRTAQQIEKLGLQKADVYSVLLGTNDWWRGEPLGTLNDYTNNTGISTVCGAFKVIITKLRSLNPQAKIILITPMQRGDFVYINNQKNTAWGSYKDKNNQWLSQFADAVKAIGKLENIEVVDLYHKGSLSVKHLVKFKRLKDRATGQYQNYKYPAYTTLPFDPETDEYPYPTQAIDKTYDGLHPSDKGNEIMAGMLVKAFKKL
jgi:lysophospholipase L1-like esterase